MISLRRIRATAVVSGLFGISAAVISATINFGVWLTTPTSLHGSLSFYIFSPLPFAFGIGCVVGVAFCMVLSVRRQTFAESLRTRRLAVAGILGGAAVGLLAAVAFDAPRDLHAVARALAGVGLLSTIGAVTAVLLARIARRGESPPTSRIVDGLTGDPRLEGTAVWAQGSGASDGERDPLRAPTH
jgi:hypothetical protein